MKLQVNDKAYLIKEGKEPIQELEQSLLEVNIIEKLKKENKELQERYDKVVDVFHRLKSLYIAEARSNPNRVLNEESFKEDWDKKAGLSDKKD